MDHLKIKRLKRFSNIFFVVGFFLTVSAIGIYFFADHMLKTQLHDNIYLGNGSKAYDIWTNNANYATVKRKYYFFNVDNPVEVEQGTAKPKLTEKGPYCFNEILTKENIHFLDKDTVQFAPVSSIHFDPSCSNGSINDPINFFNVPAAGMNEGLMSGNTGGVTYDVVELLFDFLRTKIFETKTAGELLSGYNDPLMEMASLIKPNLVKNGQFSLLNGKNGTRFMNYTMNTAYSDTYSIGKIKEYNGLSVLNTYNDKYADMLNGTDGTLFPPGRTRNQTLYAFSPDMCRSYPFEYLEDSKIDDIPTYAFHLPKNVFYNSTVSNNPNFCGEKECLGNGVMNISACYGGVSGFISLPHFLNAEPKFVDDLDGLKPDEKLHDFIFNFEPTTGVALLGNVRFQISFYMFNNPKLKLFKNLKPLLLPMIWFDEDIRLNKDILTQLGQVGLISQLCVIIPIAMLCFGIFWFVFAVGLRVYVNKLSKIKKYEYQEIKNEEKEEILNEDENKHDEKSPLITVHEADENSATIN